MLKSLALPRALEPGADRGFVLSHWPSSPDRTCDAPAGVVERGHAVAIGARRAGDAACAIVKGRYPVSVGAGAPGDARGRRERCCLPGSYGPYDHPVLRNLPEAPPSDFLIEMDGIADEIRQSEKFIPDDLQIAFRQLQRLRCPQLSLQQVADLFDEWSERDAARADAKAAEASTRQAALSAERAALFEQRLSAPPSEHDAITARIEAVGHELAAIMAPQSAEMLSLVSVRTE